MKDLGDLKIFAKVVETRSMSIAGQSFGLAPGVVSKRIKKLEENLGVRLLQRTTRQLTATETGQGFYDRIVDILAGLEAAETFVSGRSTEIIGSLKIAAPTSFGRMHIAPHLSTFMVAHPKLSLNLVLSDEFTDIVAGNYDLAIRISELKDSRLVARKLVPVRRILCAAPRYIERRGLPETISDLDHHQCLPAHNGEPWRLDGPTGSLSHRPHGMLQTNSSEVIREAVIAGLGIALRSTWDIGEDLANSRLVQVLPAYEGSTNVSISAVYPSRQFLPRKVRSFIDYLADLYGPVPYWDETR